MLYYFILYSVPLGWWEVDAHLSGTDSGVGSGKKETTVYKGMLKTSVAL